MVTENPVYLRLTRGVNRARARLMTWIAIGIGLVLTVFTVWLWIRIVQDAMVPGDSGIWSILALTFAVNWFVSLLIMPLVLFQSARITNQEITATSTASFSQPPLSNEVVFDGYLHGISVRLQSFRKMAYSLTPLFFLNILLYVVALWIFQALPRLIEDPPGPDRFTPMDLIFGIATTLGIFVLAAALTLVALIYLVRSWYRLAVMAGIITPYWQRQKPAHNVILLGMASLFGLILVFALFSLAGFVFRGIFGGAITLILALLLVPPILTGRLKHYAIRTIEQTR